MHHLLPTGREAASLNLYNNENASFSQGMQKHERKREREREKEREEEEEEEEEEERERPKRREEEETNREPWENKMEEKEQKRDQQFQLNYGKIVKRLSISCLFACFIWIGPLCKGI